VEIRLRGEWGLGVQNSFKESENYISVLKAESDSFALNA
jgi:hypothetical protein